MLSSENYDSKGDPLSGSRSINRNHYKDVVDWKQNITLEEPLTSYTTYDALDRSITVTLPDNTIIRSTYNLDSRIFNVRANLQGRSKSQIL
jgi:YD repeat-containing protein